MLAAARKHVGLKGVGMTGEYWKMREIAKAERERYELSERLGIHSEECKSKDEEVNSLTSEREAEIWERTVTTAKGKKEMRSIQRILTTSRSVTTARFIIDNGKNFISQKQKNDGFVRIYRDVSNGSTTREARERNEEGA